MRKNKNVLIFLTVLLFVLGLAVFSYPYVNGLLVNMKIKTNAEEFLSWVKTDLYIPDPSESQVILEEEEFIPEKYPDLWLAMKAYNKEIYRTVQTGLDGKRAYEEPSFILSEYGLESEIFAVLSIPDLEIEMPVYLGATSRHMADGAAVMSQTSIPIGGENTNAVIAGHRGWNGAHYFLYINKLEEGDQITITNLWETLTYEVRETKIIMPNEVEKIHIQPDRDLVTLLSCHPPGSGGKQRYLVICERIENESDTEIHDQQETPGV